jgi:hypothetical protein
MNRANHATIQSINLPQQVLAAKSASIKAVANYKQFKP